MFGKNPIMKQEKDDMGTSLKVVDGSPFYTVQGEGPFAGHPSAFIRLHGCNLRCTFCDTEFSNPTDPEWQVVKLARKVYDMNHVDGLKFTLVVITGGEPLRQNIAPLCRFLLKAGYTVQIETAGTLWWDAMSELMREQEAKDRLHIVVSPKTGTVREEILRHAKAFKYVVSSETQFSESGIPYSDTQGTGRIKALAAPLPGTPVYLSPCDEYDEAKNKANTTAVYKMAQAFGFIAGLQIHKYFGVE